MSSRRPSKQVKARKTKKYLNKSLMKEGKRKKMKQGPVKMLSNRRNMRKNLRGW
jgi:hypothetical protein